MFPLRPGSASGRFRCIHVTPLEIIQLQFDTHRYNNCQNNIWRMTAVASETRSESVSRLSRDIIFSPSTIFSYRRSSARENTK
jgi:hypothetical protein